MWDAEFFCISSSYIDNGGTVIAFGVTRLLTSFLYGVSTSDATTFAAIPIVLLVVAVAASILPARRAMKIDPIRALKSE